MTLFRTDEEFQRAWDEFLGVYKRIPSDQTEREQLLRAARSLDPKLKINVQVGA